jgi:hypothetical protein
MFSVKTVHNHIIPLDNKTRGLVSSGANEGNYHISRRRSIVDATALLLEGGKETIRRTFPRRIRQTTIEKYRKKIEEALSTLSSDTLFALLIFHRRENKENKKKENNPRQNSSTKPTTAAAAAFYSAGISWENKEHPAARQQPFLLDFYFFHLFDYINVICEFVYYYSLVKRFTQRTRGAI